MSAAPITAIEFKGFTPDAMRFFEELADNQNKEWMAANKARYEGSVREPLAALVIALNDRFEREGISLRGDPKRSLFRINRDVRFSADKRPYNDHASAALTRDGDKQSPGVLYMQFSPAGSFAAAGFFRPEADMLHRLREGVVADPKGWKAMTAALDAVGLSLGRDDTLVRPPKGFESADAEIADDLKLKSWTVTRTLSPHGIDSPKLVELLVKFGQEALPLLEFGWSALARASSGSLSGSMADRS